MRRDTERNMLRAAVALACLVPLTMGTMSVLRGPAVIHGMAGAASPDLDSHFRYLSGIFLAMGLWFVTCVPHIEHMGPRFRLLGSMVIAGGLARLLSLVEIGAPGGGHYFGLAMELGVVPLLLVWQARVAKRFGE